MAAGYVEVKFEGLVARLSMTVRLGTLMILLVLGFTGCTNPDRTKPSTLQQFDALRSPLLSITSESRAVQVKTTLLAHAESSGNVTKIRHSANMLRSEARSFSMSSGKLANTIRALKRHERDRVVRQYFARLVWALSWNWHEGRTLLHLCALLSRDPFGLIPQTIRSVQRVQRAAQHDASEAVRSAARADQLRERYPNRFRYLPESKR
jgi:hypothetical protein